MKNAGYTTVFSAWFLLSLKACTQSHRKNGRKAYNGACKWVGEMMSCFLLWHCPYFFWIFYNEQTFYNKEKSIISRDHFQICLLVPKTLGCWGGETGHGKCIQEGRHLATAPTTLSFATSRGPASWGQEESRLEVTTVTFSTGGREGVHYQALKVLPNHTCTYHPDLSNLIEA